LATIFRIFVEEIGYDPSHHTFIDLEDREIRYLFKLYPWEWMLAEDFGQYLPDSSTQFFEPPWKLVLSNKGILPILWEMHPGHPNLLPCGFEPPLNGCSFVKKPLYSREGANVTVVHNGNVITLTEGSYGQEGFIYQEFSDLPAFEGQHAVIGSWVISGEAAGIGIREDRNTIIQNRSRFVPHYFVP
jgi:glutathionylspermidine synthase